MTTVTKTFTDNYYDSASYKKTWTVNHNFTDITASASTFSITSPTITAKFVGTTGTYRWEQIDGTPQIGGHDVYDTVTSKDVYWLWQDPANINTGSTIAGTSNTLFTATKRTPASENHATAHTITASTYDFFTSANNTKRTLDVTISLSYLLSTGVSGQISNINTTKAQYSSNGYVGYFKIGTLTLNAPPQVTLGTPIYSSPQYAGLGTYSVPLTTLSAQYGGNITSVTLTVGADSTTQTYSTQTVSNKTISVTPTNAGTFTPTVSVTDSRGQTTTKQLSQIVVNGYSVPAVNFDVYRTNSNGVKDDEGTYGLIKASIIYTSAVATLTSPSVSIADSDGTTVTPSSITWYSSYSSSTGVSVAISDWSLVASGDEIYGLIDASFSTTDSYQVTVTETDSLNGSSIPITQTLSTAFYTIDFQAGGKEIAFGAPANDTLTQKQEQIGLFKCAMDTEFNDMTSQEVEDFVDALNVTGINAVDYVVEYGTSTFGGGSVRYRKWNSGKCEFWYHLYASSGASTEVWITPIYYHDYNSWANVWSGYFVSAPTYVTCSSNNSQFISINAYSWDTNGISAMRFLSVGAKSNVAYSFTLYAVGLWK